MTDCKAKGSYYSFQKLCDAVAADSARLKKTSLISTWLESYTGDLVVFLELILPKVVKRVYNLSNKKLWKLFGIIFNLDAKVLETMYIKGDNAGDIGGVISQAYSMLDDDDDSDSPEFPIRTKKSQLSMKQVNDYLIALTKETKYDAQCELLRKICKECNINDLKWFIRQIDKDLRIDAGTKAVLDAVHSDAHKAFQTRADLKYIANKAAMGAKNFTIAADLLSPMKPMLASACSSYEEAFEKCKSGVIFAEIKYDGERVQVHWDGQSWKFYARSLKEVAASKIEHVKDAIGEAMPDAKTLILDSEILMVDSKTGDPLPFGSLGKHKKKEFANATPCLFVFDILYYNGASLIKQPLKKRRTLLESNFKEVKNKIHLSKLHKIDSENKDKLRELMEKMINSNQEGLVLKDSNGVYAPNKRHWLKMKRDYLAGAVGAHKGAKVTNKGGNINTNNQNTDYHSNMADSADLVVLGAYKGSGKHGGLYSTFLCGVLDKDLQQFKTVCKVHNGLDDEQLQTYTDTLNMLEFDKNNIPRWLDVLKEMYPDWVVANPKKSPIFEVTGFEFTISKRHTATNTDGQGISIRFPRVTRIRTDKKYQDATSLNELRYLVNESRNNPENILAKAKNKGKTPEKEGNKEKRKNGDNDNDDEDEDEPPKKKQKLNNGASIGKYFQSETDKSQTKRKDKSNDENENENEHCVERIEEQERVSAFLDEFDLEFYNDDNNNNNKEKENGKNDDNNNNDSDNSKEKQKGNENENRKNNSNKKENGKKRDIEIEDDDDNDDFDFDLDNNDDSKDSNHNKDNNNKNNNDNSNGKNEKKDKNGGTKAKTTDEIEGIGSLSISISPPPSPLKYDCQDANDGRKSCKFGAGCYRKNPQHFKEYSHSTKEDKEMNDLTQKMQAWIDKLVENATKEIKDAKANEKMEIEKATKLLENAKKEHESAIEKAKQTAKDIISKAKEKRNENIAKLKKNHVTKIDAIRAKYNPSD